APYTPIQTLFPYTTLFRSLDDGFTGFSGHPGTTAKGFRQIRCARSGFMAMANACVGRNSSGASKRDSDKEQSLAGFQHSKCIARSEEHTSELQSPDQLVCR